MNPIKLCLSADRQQFILYCEYQDRHKSKKAGGRWNAKLRAWTFAFDISIYEHLCRLFQSRLTLQLGVQEFIDLKMQKNVEVASLKEIAKENKDIDFEVDGISLDGKNPLYNYQKHGVRFATKADGGVLIADEMGLGKYAINSTPVMTCDGFIEIGNIKLGDKVYGKDGELHNVVGVYPQGVKPLYRIVFNDDTYVDCGATHLWNVARPDYAKRGIPWKTLETQDLIGDLTFKNGARKWQIPLVDPINYSKKELVIPPFILGVLIADGCILQGTYYTPGNTEIPALIDGRIQKYMKHTKGVDYGTSTSYHISYPNHKNNIYTDYIRSVNLNVTGEYKFIPKEYLLSSIEQRKELLAGLLDSDGTVTGARVRYSTSSKQLAEDVCQLTRSLGGIATYSLFKGRLRTRKGKVTQELDNYQVNVRTLFNPFLRPSNRKKWKQSTKLVKNIKSIEYLKDADATCIRVDAKDHLFVIKDYIVTHNSIQALATQKQLVNEGRTRTALVICPASLKYNWMNEVAKFSNLTSLVIDGSVDERFNKWFAPNIDIKIVNFEILTRDLFYFGDKAKDKKDKKDRDYRIPNYQVIIDNYFNCVIIDECHYLASHSAQRSIACKSLKTKFRIGLTGTPLDGALEQFHSIFEFIKPGLFPTKFKFLDYHAIFDFWGGVKSYIRVDEFKDKISPYYIRRLKKEVLTDLPPKIYKDVYVDLKPKAMKEYRKIASQKHEITEDEPKIVTIIRCRQYCDMPEILELDTKSDKMIALKEILDEVIRKNNNKVVLFSQYTSATDILERELKKEGYKVGGLNLGKNRFDACEIFNEDNSYDIMIMTDAGAVGLTLIGNTERPCNTVIMYDQNYSPAINLQRADRCHRIGALDTVTVINLIVKDTIEERVKQSIDSKHKFSCEVLDEDLSEMSLGKALSTKELFGLL